MTEIDRLIGEAELLVKDTKALVEKGWERRSRLREAEEYLKGLLEIKSRG